MSDIKLGIKSFKRKPVPIWQGFDLLDPLKIIEDNAEEDSDDNSAIIGGDTNEYTSKSMQGKRSRAHIQIFQLRLCHGNPDNTLIWTDHMS